jgi:hypothetical protein
MDEGWKSALAGAALAGATAVGAQAQTPAHQFQTPMAQVTSPDDPSWHQLNKPSDIKVASQTTTRSGEKNGVAIPDEYDFQVASVQGPNNKGEYLVRVVNNDNIVTDYVTKNPPKPSTFIKANQPLTKEPQTNEAANPAQQAAIAIAMKKAGKKPKNENDDFDDGEWADDPEQHAVVKAQQPTRYPEAVLRAIERNPGMRADIIADYKRKQGVAETALNPRDPKGDYAAKRKALQDLGMNKDVDQQAVLQRRLDLDREAKAKGIAEDTGSWIVYDPETKQIKKRFKTHTAGKSYAKTHGLGFASSEYYFDRVKEKAMAEAQTDYQKRRARERDVDAGRPVKALPKNPQTDYARKRAKDRKDMELGEDINDDNDNAVEQAILRRIMVAHTDLLKQYGPEKVMLAAEIVSYNIGDVEEIGSSDVSAYVDQVKQILGTV